ncbi:MAG: hypothetical protein M3443_16210, partial [Actinomycetota bacterium]|nr:hypothetical protein [Actinomycetota bacterium]
MAGKQVSHRNRAVVGLLSVLLLLLAACGAPGGEESDDTVVVGGSEDPATEAPAGDDSEPAATEQEATGEPIKIGFLAATTGVAASSGQDMVRG